MQTKARSARPLPGPWPDVCGGGVSNNQQGIFNCQMKSVAHPRQLLAIGYSLLVVGYSFAASEAGAPGQVIVCPDGAVGACFKPQDGRRAHHSHYVELRIT